MNTLTVRLVVALLLTLSLGFSLLIFWNQREFREQGPWRLQHSAMRYIADEAERVWLDQGRAGLVPFFGELKRYFPDDFGWFDPYGHDLMGGPDRPELAVPNLPPPEGPFEKVAVEKKRRFDRPAPDKAGPQIKKHRRGQQFRRFEPNHSPPVRVENGLMAFLVPTASGQFRLVHFVSPPPPLHVPYGPALALGFGLLLFGLIMSHQVTRPIRELKRSLESFGQGELSRRCNMDRRDEIGDLSRTFNRMADQISGIVERERGLVRNVAHEVRGPLTRMKLLLEKLRENRDTSRTLNRLDAEITTLGHIPDSLLHLARIETGNFEASPIPTRIGPFLEQILERFGTLSEKLAVPIVPVGDPIPERTIGVDSALLERAFENILENAMRHAPAATTVNLETHFDDRTLELKVRDFGAGVPESELQEIFQPFFRSDRSRNRHTGGIGLGLAIARASVAAMGGSIEAANVSPGLEVTIRVPVVDLKDPDREPESFES